MVAPALDLALCLCFLCCFFKGGLGTWFDLSSCCPPYSPLEFRLDYSIHRSVLSKKRFGAQGPKTFVRGNEIDDRSVCKVGVKDRSKLLLLEEMTSKERKLEEREEVMRYQRHVVALEATMNGGTTVEDKEFVVLIELFMRRLLKLDGIEAEGEAKVQRRAEVSSQCKSAEEFVVLTFFLVCCLNR
ncbi:hypothetical protein AAG906_025400 [Vitis piasezkii]